jgi:hypothetical protein
VVGEDVLIQLADPLPVRDAFPRSSNASSE